MLGYVSLEKCRRVRGEKEEICGRRFLHVILPEKPTERQIRKAVRILQKNRVNRAVFPAGYSVLPWEKYGVKAMDTSAFRRIFLRRILAWALEKRVCVRAGICAHRVDLGVQTAARMFAGKSRYLLLDCGQGTEELSFALRREFGVAAVTEPTVSQLAGCDILVAFLPQKDVLCRGITLPFYNGAERPWQYCFPATEKYPQADAEQLGAALLEMGVLWEKDVKII